jgi:hypothetical protein
MQEREKRDERGESRGPALLIFDFSFLLFDFGLELLRRAGREG